MCPFQIETDLANQLGGPKESIRGGDRDSFLVTVYRENQSNKMKWVEQIARNKCQVSEENFLNTTKGLANIQNYHIEDLKSFTGGVNEQCRVKELVESKWIKPRRETTQVFMITFMNDKLPEFNRIPGEAERIKVYEYKDQPMLCKKCWKYGHTKKRCLSQVVLCGRCVGPGHQSGGNYGGAHISGHSSCLDRKKELTMLEIHKKQEVGRALAHR